MSATLENYEELLKRTQEMFLEENSLLKEKKLAEHTALMPRKAELLEQLTTGLKTLQQNRDSKNPLDKEKARQLQDRIMRLLMLDRENEQLLIKLSSFNTAPRVTAQSLEKAYKKI